MAIATEGWSGERVGVQPVERDEAGVDGEASGAGRSVRWLRGRNGAVTFLKTAKARIETSRSCRAPSSGRGATGAHVGRGRQARDSAIDNGQVAGPERHDDGVIPEKELTRKGERLNVEAGRRAVRGRREHVRW